MNYAFRTATDVLRLTQKYHISVGELGKRYEAELSHMSLSAVRSKMKKRRDVLYGTIRLGLKSTAHSESGLSGGDAHKLWSRIRRLKGMMGNKVTVRAMAYALAVVEQNAAMGQIVAFPTAGGAGVVPGVLFSGSECFRARKRRLLAGMFTSAAVGIVIAEGATFSAAEAGCQAEIGAAAAMAAAGLTEMRGGTPQQCLDSAAIALKSYLGLVCDPLAGLVEAPCVKRNALATQAAIGASDMVMVGIHSLIPFDEVVATMKKIGKMMSPKLRETALGGLAMTPTGILAKKQLEERMNGNSCGGCGRNCHTKTEKEERRLLQSVKEGKKEYAKGRLKGYASMNDALKSLE